MKKKIIKKIKNIKLVLTDSDGVLTDGGVYYGAQGEVMKRFYIRDGMGVVLLRNILNLETSIITGETSPSVKQRAKKLKIMEVHLGIADKKTYLKKYLKTKQLKWKNIAYIGDDINDFEVLKKVGFSATPSDGIEPIKSIVDYRCVNSGGNGAFREFAELIIKYNK